MKKLLIFLALAAGSLTVAAQTKYVVVDLGSAGGTSTQTSATNINNAGQVAGSSTNADFSFYRAYRTAPNQPINPATDLIPLPAGATYNYVNTNALNNSGQVAFNAGLKDGFRLDADGTTHDLGNLGGLAESNAWAINDSGQVTGEATVSFDYYPGCIGADSLPAFRTEADSAINPATDNLGTLLAGAIPFYPFNVSGCRSAIGTAINSLGQVVGYSAALNASPCIYGAAYQLYCSILDPEQHAMLVTGTTMQDLGLLGGTVTYPVVAGKNATAYAINTAGQIVGQSTYNGALYYYAYHAFLTTAAGPMTDLGTLGGNFSSASGINSSGQIVGNASTAGDAANDGFLYTGGTMYDLNSLIAPGSPWQIVNATAINDNGQIAATAWENGVKFVGHAVRLDPANVAVTNLTSLLSDPTLGLTSGETASLTDKLNNTLASIQAGLNKQAINQLDAFISSVQSSVKTGKISASAGATLIAAANAIIGVL